MLSYATHKKTTLLQGGLAFPAEALRKKANCLAFLSASSLARLIRAGISPK